MGEFEVKDSGVRQEYPSGMRRDTQEGKPNFLLAIDGPMFRRYADHMTKGAAKYGARNWQLANSEEELERFKASALRHMIQWLSGDVDEDHAAAVWFNVNAAEYVEARLSLEELLIERVVAAEENALEALFENFEPQGLGAILDIEEYPVDRELPEDDTPVPMFPRREDHELFQRLDDDQRGVFYRVLAECEVGEQYGWCPFFSSLIPTDWVVSGIADHVGDFVFERVR